MAKTGRRGAPKTADLSPRERFVHYVNPRVQKAVSAIQSVAKLAGPRYEDRGNEAEQIANLLQEEVNRLRYAFESGAPAAGGLISLDDSEIEEEDADDDEETEDEDDDLEL